MSLRKILEMDKSELIKFIKTFNPVCNKNSWLLQPKQMSGKVCLVAHIDTVFDNNIGYIIPDGNKRVFHDREYGVYWSPDGLGADDRAGVYACLKLFKETPEPYKPIILLTDHEETGCLGAYEASTLWKEKLSEANLFLELDRRGNSEVVFYNQEPNKFRNYIKNFGFKEAPGIFTDISVICSELHICGANLSIGYYNNHSKSEYLVEGELNETIKKVVNILKDNHENGKKWRLKTPRPHENIVICHMCGKVSFKDTMFCYFCWTPIISEEGGDL